MSTPVQWVTHSETSAKGGWMLGAAAPRRVSKLRTRKIAYADASSRFSSPRGWMLSPYSSRPASKAVEPILLGKTADAVFLNYQALSAYQIDDLAADGCDWISLLPSDGTLEVLNLSLLGVEFFNSDWFQSALPVDKLVQLTQQAKHYLVTLSGSVFWSYTCCLQLADLGRMRFVVCQQDDTAGGKYVAFITNRLDWSPRKVMSQSLQLFTLPSLFDHRGAGALVQKR